VGEVVGARLVLGEAAEELVAVGPGQAAPVVERAPGAAVGVADELGVADRLADPLGAVVQLGRQRAHLEIPAAAPGDAVDVQRERAAGDNGLRHPGKASWSMNRSLKSLRPESST